jgi:3-hydroxyacyl-[acyl-carrier-protein] dehydratase
MLLNDFYFISQLSSQMVEGKTQLDAVIALNKSHPIFEGHFPGQPIVPGVCMIQMMKEIMQVHLNKKLVVESAGNIKFLSMLIPKQQSEVNAEVRFTTLENHIEVEAKLFAGEIIFFKIKAVLSDGF